MTRLRDRPDDLDALVGQAAADSRLPFEFIEKDFWVVELLRSVAEQSDDAVAIFKGGTSLSKAFSLIERFSEDVDILLDVPRSEEPGFGKGSVDRILKTICARVGEHLSLASDRQVLEGSTTGLRRAVRYLYPTQGNHQVLAAGVLLEMGVRGGKFPRSRRTLSSYLAEYARAKLSIDRGEYQEFAPVEIDVLDPVRTLVEKLALLHDLASRYPNSSDRLLQMGRHYYDVHQLLHVPDVQGALRRPGFLQELATDIDRQSEAYGWTFTPRPEGGYAASPAFDTDHSCQRAVRSSYDAALKLIYGAKPSLDECLNAVCIRAELL